MSICKTLALGIKAKMGDGIDERGRGEGDGQSRVVMPYKVRYQ